MGLDRAESSIRRRILMAIQRCSRPIEEDELKEFQVDLVSQIDRFIKTSKDRVVCSIGGNPIRENLTMGLFDHLLHRHEEAAQYAQELPRIVVIGDIHSDLAALAGIFHKLSVSAYDYFERAIFIFLGDYVDRGALPLQTMLLLLNLHEILGERCILLKGNHDEIHFDESKKRFVSPVTPAETVDLFMQYFEVATIEKVARWFEHLPYIVKIERGEFRYLVVHGGIPKDNVAADFSMEGLSDLKLPLHVDDAEAKKVVRALKTMLWGDPVVAKFKLASSESRFEFGSEQFLACKERSQFTHMIRGHEPTSHGFKSMFDGFLYTLFSSGGKANTNSYYSDAVPYPAFGIIKEDGTLIGEQVFVYKTVINDDNRRPAESADLRGYRLIENEQTGEYSFATGGTSPSDTEDLPAPDEGFLLADEFALGVTSPPFLRKQMSSLLTQTLEDAGSNNGAKDVEKGGTS